jgi:hypothetical protein
MSQLDTVECRNCKYWTGQPGTYNEWTKARRQPIVSTVVICAVRIQPQPNMFALDMVDYRLADAEHDCPDFERLDRNES